MSSELVNKVHNLDALDFLALLEPQSVDAIITDLPYGTTACKWDTIIPFAPMWAVVKRVLKPRGVFVTTASQPFTSALVMSNPAWFHEELVWDKKLSTGFLDANRKHLKRHENAIVFCEGMPTYNPQKTKGEPYSRPPKKMTPIYGKFIELEGDNLSGDRYPTTILEFSNACRLDTVHPTQKPVALYEYLISTYTQPGELVVDPCCGSGTTGVAARNLKRDYVLNDSAAEYVEIARDRLRGAWDKPRQKESDLSGLPLFDICNFE